MKANTGDVSQDKKNSESKRIVFSMETQRDHRLGTVISPFFRCPSLGSAVFDLQRIWQEANFLGHFADGVKEVARLILTTE